MIEACQMTEASSFLRELDEAVSRGTPESRARALWHTTDVMITGSYSDDEIWTFGAVIGRLADESKSPRAHSLQDGSPASIARLSMSFTSWPLTTQSTSRARCSGIRNGSSLTR